MGITPVAASDHCTTGWECSDLVPEAPDFTFDPGTARCSAAQANVTEVREAVAAMQDTVAPGTPPSAPRAARADGPLGRAGADAARPTSVRAPSP